MKLGTKQQYAAHRGCTKAYLSKPEIVERLRPAMVSDPASGRLLVDFEKADALFVQHRDPSRFLGRTAALGPRPTRDADGKPNTFETTKHDRELLKLEQDQMNLLDRKSQTLSRKDTEAACAAAGQLLRDSLQSRNQRLADKAATMKDAREIKIMLDAADRSMIETVNDALVRRLFPNEPGKVAATTH